VQREANRRLCSASDIVRLSLLNFFERECQTKHDQYKIEEVAL